MVNMGVVVVVVAAADDDDNDVLDCRVVRCICRSTRLKTAARPPPYIAPIHRSKSSATRHCITCINNSVFYNLDFFCGKV